MKEDPRKQNAELLLKGVRILWPGSEHDGAELDISVKGGKVERIGKELEVSEEQTLIRKEGLHLSPGWFDMNADFRDPGHEEKEDLYSGSRAAMQGGYTRILLMPSTDPPIDDRGAVEDIKARTGGMPLTVHPAGCISKGREGHDIAELYDMFSSGAAAFTDARKPVSDSGLFTNALWYARTFDAPLLTFPDDPTISRQGLMNEGELSMRLGVKGIPGMSERIAVDRDLQLLEYTGGRLHFSTISSRAALDSIRKAKADGLAVSCDVAAHHLFFDEERLRTHSPFFKFMPPLRDAKQIEALREGVKDGTIDHICSLHEPHAQEDKMIEFDNAAFGAPGLECSFGAAGKALQGESSPKTLIELLSLNPRRILGIEVPELKEGAELEATLFDPEENWTCTKDQLRSKAFRNPYEGEELLGKAFGTVHNGLFHRCS